MRGQASDLGSNWLLTGNLDFSRDYLEAIQQCRRGRHRARRPALPARRPVHRFPRWIPEGTSNRRRVADGHAAPARAAGEIQRFRVVERPAAARARGRSTSAGVRGRRLPRWPAHRDGALDNGLTKLFSRVLLKGTAKAAPPNRSPRRSRRSEAESAARRVTTVSASRWRSCSPISTWVWTCWRTCLLNATLPSEVIEREKAVQIAAIKARRRARDQSSRATFCVRRCSARIRMRLRPAGSAESVNGSVTARIWRSPSSQKYLVANNGVRSRCSVT